MNALSAKQSTMRAVCIVKRAEPFPQCIQSRNNHLPKQIAIHSLLIGNALPLSPLKDVNELADTQRESISER